MGPHLGWRFQGKVRNLKALRSLITLSWLCEGSSRFSMTGILRKDLDIRPTELVAESVGKGLLPRLVDVVDGLAGKGWHFQAGN